MGKLANACFFFRVPAFPQDYISKDTSELAEPYPNAKKRDYRSSNAKKRDSARPSFTRASESEPNGTPDSDESHGACDYEFFGAPVSESHGASEPESFQRTLER